MLPLPAYAEIERQPARRPPAVLDIPGVRVLVVGGYNRRVVDLDLRRRSWYAADRVGDEHAVARKVVRVAVGAAIQIDADAGLELVPPRQRAFGKEADAIFRLVPVARLVLMERRRAGIQCRREIVARRRIGARVRPRGIVIGHVPAVAADGVHEHAGANRALELELLNGRWILVVACRFQRRETVRVVLRLGLRAALPCVHHALVLR